MVDTINDKQDLGYHFTDCVSVNLVQYADDTCLVENSPSAGQKLPNLVERWLSWSGMRAKVPKCHALGLNASVGKLVDPDLSITGQKIPFASEQVKFLGRHFELPHDTNRVKKAILSRLQKMFNSVDTCPLTRGQKLKLYRGEVCPRLALHLTIEDLPISWVEKKLGAIAIWYVKRWAGLARAANSSILYLPQKMGSLNLPLISTYKCFQVSHQSQLLTSPDSCVRLMVEDNLQCEVNLQRQKFRPRVVV